MSQPSVTTIQALIKDFDDWVSFDDEPDEARFYGSITEMKTAPLELNAETAELFRAAKRC